MVIPLNCDSKIVMSNSVVINGRLLISFLDMYIYQAIPLINAQSKLMALPLNTKGYLYALLISQF